MNLEDYWIHQSGRLLDSPIWKITGFTNPEDYRIHQSGMQKNKCGFPIL